MSSLGETLRKERESRKIPLDEIARETRISESYLAALESDDLQALPGTVFNKGFVRAYARHLGLDPEPLLRAYTEEESALASQGRMPESPDILEGLRDSVERSARRSGRSRAPLATIAFLAAAAAVVAGGWFLLPRDRSGIPTGDDVPGPVPAEARPSRVTGPLEPTEPVPAAGDASARGAATASLGDPDRGRRSDRSEGPEEATPSRGAPAGEPPASETPGGVTRPQAEKPAASTTEDAGSRPREAVPEEPAQTAAPAAEDRPLPEVTPTAGARLAVPEFGVGSRVVNRQLEGESGRFAEGSSVWFWTRVTGGRRGDTIRHVWIHEGIPVGTVTLTVGGSHWRTYSRRRLTSASLGSWTVEARNAQGRVLATQAFVCEPASP